MTDDRLAEARYAVLERLRRAPAGSWVHWRPLHHSLGHTMRRYAGAALTSLLADGTVVEYYQATTGRARRFVRLADPTAPSIW